VRFAWRRLGAKEISNSVKDTVGYMFTNFKTTTNSGPNDKPWDGCFCS
jgi:hypothetical protein